MCLLDLSVIRYGQTKSYCTYGDKLRLTGFWKYYLSQEERNILHVIKKRLDTWLAAFCLGTAF